MTDDTKKIPKWYSEGEDDESKKDEVPWYNRPKSTDDKKESIEATLLKTVRDRQKKRRKKQTTDYIEAVKKRKKAVNVTIAGLSSINPKWGQQFSKKKKA
jgi:hypothetical protein